MPWADMFRPLWGEIRFAQHQNLRFRLTVEPPLAAPSRPVNFFLRGIGFLAPLLVVILLFGGASLWPDSLWCLLPEG